MRTTSELWVSALMRRVLSSGGFAALERRGHHEAGAVFVRVRSRDGSETLYGPAPQIAYDQARPSERQFSVVAENAEGAEVDRRLEKETRFDPDVWIVELEPGGLQVEDLLTIMKP